MKNQTVLSMCCQSNRLLIHFLISHHVAHRHSVSGRCSTSMTCSVESNGRCSICSSASFMLQWLGAKNKSKIQENTRSTSVKIYYVPMYVRPLFWSAQENSAPERKSFKKIYFSTQLYVMPTTSSFNIILCHSTNCTRSGAVF